MRRDGTLVMVHRRWKMRSIIVGFTVCVVAVATGGDAQEGKASTHVLLAPAELKWGPAPPALPKGGMVVVLSGDPGKPGPFALRLRMPAGYKIAPHWHPTDEQVTVLAGTMALGMGEKFDPAVMKAVRTGGYALLPAEMRHFAMARTAATIEVHGMGPFVLNYVNPADDPSKASGPQ
jgi:hypothetical protein